MTARADDASPRTSWKFDFAPVEPSSGYVHVFPTNSYSKDAGWGFEPDSSVVAQQDGGVTSSRPFLFSVALPEGNYEVVAGFGEKTAATTNTVKSEARRLMVENLTTAPGETVSRRFIVNTRTPKYPGGEVKLKSRETTSEFVIWDDKLTLEFNGSRPGLQTLTINPATNVVTVYISGDSTVCDQAKEPWNSWGQMLPRFFNDHVAVANYAESGESVRSSLGAHRFDKIFSIIKPGDFLFIQFGHNDMKDKSPDALQIYKSNLKLIVTRTREKGATPVLVTSMERKGGVNGDTLAGYPDAVREVAGKEGVALVDLNKASLKLYRALGNDLNLAFQDGTHHNNYGSYELARCVVEGIKTAKLSLADFLAADYQPFDPSSPDDPKKFHMAESPMQDKTKPEGN